MVLTRMEIHIPKNVSRPIFIERGGTSQRRDKKQRVTSIRRIGRERVRACSGRKREGRAEDGAPGTAIAEGGRRAVFVF